MLLLPGGVGRPCKPDTPIPCRGPASSVTSMGGEDVAVVESDRKEQASSQGIDFTLPGSRSEDVVTALKEAAVALSVEVRPGCALELDPVRVVRYYGGDVCRVVMPVHQTIQREVERDGHRWAAPLTDTGYLTFSLTAEPDGGVYVTAKVLGGSLFDLRSGVLKHLASRFDDPRQRRALLGARLDAVGTTLQKAPLEEPVTTDGAPGGSEVAGGSADRLVPSRLRDLRRWQEAWQVIEHMRDESRDTEDWGDDPRPTLDDYRDRLSVDISWRPSVRTIQKIVKAGERGMLDTPDRQ